VKPMDLKNWRLWHLDATGAGTCVALTFLAYFAGFRSLASSHAASATRQNELNRQRRKCSELRASSSALEARVVDVQQQLAKSPVRLQSGRHVNQRIAEITELAGSCGLKVDDIGLGQTFSTSHYRAVPIHVAGTGSYGTCMVFLQRINQTFPDTAVSKLELLRAAQRRSMVSTFKLSLLWHVAPEDGPPEK